MIIKKRIIAIELEIYECSHPQHRHIKRSAAEACIKLNERADRGIFKRKSNQEFRVRVMCNVLEELSFTRAGRKMGVSPQRVRGMFYRIIQKLRFRYRQDDININPTSSGESLLVIMQRNSDLWVKRLKKLDDEEFSK